MIELEHITKSISKKMSSINKNSMLVAGIVNTVNDGVVRIKGLDRARYGELVRINNSYALIMNLEENSVGAVLLTNTNEVVSGDLAYLTDRVMDVGVSDSILSRVISPLGTPMDNKGKIEHDEYRLLEFPAPEIAKRGAVNSPLQTGIKAIDAMVPIGKGQRELIIGDRETGKTAIAVDTIINQKGKNVICIYAAIGQKASSTANVIKVLEEHGAMSYTTVVCSSASDSPSMQYLAPYTAVSIAEYFMYKGRDVLIVYDDLTKHAVAYRTLSLLLGRPSGREAYPGDIFYTHSRLLERAAKMGEKYGGGSITALPIVETLLDDISQYIPTNVISITDGQLFLTNELFNSGIRPAVNVGLSVSRVGGSAQIKAMRKISSQLRLDLAHYRELAIFSQFANDLDPETKAILDNGERLTEALKQSQYKPQNVEKQVVFLYAVINKMLDQVPVNRIQEGERVLEQLIENYAPEVYVQIKTTGEMTDEIKQKIKEIAVKVELK